MQILIQLSKTNHWGRRVHDVVRVSGLGATCPVWAMMDFLGVRHREGVQLLVNEDGSRLTAYQFTALMRRGLERLGMDEKRFVSHAFRIGVAMEAERFGMPWQDIMSMDRWRSRRFLTGTSDIAVE